MVVLLFFVMTDENIKENEYCTMDNHHYDPSAEFSLIDQLYEVISA